MATRVFVSEDHPVYREGLVESIRERQGLELIGEAADGIDALARIRELSPDVAVLDLRLPGIDGMGVLKALRESESPTRVILLSAYSEGALVYEAMQDGAAGYLSKDSAAEEICRAIHAVAQGETVLSPGLDRKLARHINQSTNSAATPSGRETQVLKLMADGLSSAAIGEQLHLSEGTVKTYVRRVYEKLGVSNRSAAIAEAMRRGILH